MHIPILISTWAPIAVTQTTVGTVCLMYVFLKIKESLARKHHQKVKVIPAVVILKTPPQELAQPVIAPEISTNVAQGLQALSTFLEEYGIEDFFLNDMIEQCHQYNLKNRETKEFSDIELEKLRAELLFEKLAEVSASHMQAASLLDCIKLLQANYKNYFIEAEKLQTVSLPEVKLHQTKNEVAASTYLRLQRKFNQF